MQNDKKIKSFKDLDVYQRTYKAAIVVMKKIIPKLPDNEKEKIFSSIRNLHTVVEEIDTQLEQLMTTCPADWSSNRQTIDSKMSELRQTLGNLSEQVNGPLIPDSLSWVS